MSPVFCAHPACLHALRPGNVSGVCRNHMHGQACRCSWCVSPRSRVGKRRGLARSRIKTRAELIAEGLLLPDFFITVRGMP